MNKMKKSKRLLEQISFDFQSDPFESIDIPDSDISRKLQSSISLYSNSNSSSTSVSQNTNHNDDETSTFTCGSALSDSIPHNKPTTFAPKIYPNTQPSNSNNNNNNNTNTVNINQNNFLLLEKQLQEVRIKLKESNDMLNTQKVQFEQLLQQIQDRCNEENSLLKEQLDDYKRKFESEINLNNLMISESMYNFLNEKDVETLTLKEIASLAVYNEVQKLKSQENLLRNENDEIHSNLTRVSEEYQLRINDVIEEKDKLNAANMMLQDKLENYRIQIEQLTISNNELKLFHDQHIKTNLESETAILNSKDSVQKIQEQDLQINLLLKENQLYQNKLRTAESELSHTQTLFTETKSNYENTRQQLKLIETTNHKLDIDYNTMNNKYNDLLNKYNNLKLEFDSNSNNDINYQQKIIEYTTQISTLLKDIDISNYHNQEIQLDNKNLKIQYDSLNSQHKELNEMYNTRCQQYEECITTYQQDNYKLKLDKDSLLNDIDEYKLQINQLTDKLNKLESQFIYYSKQFEDVANTKAELKLLKEYTNNESIPTLRSELSKINIEFEKSKENTKKLTEENRELKKQNDVFNNILSNIEQPKSYYIKKLQTKETLLLEEEQRSNELERQLKDLRQTNLQLVTESTEMKKDFIQLKSFVDNLKAGVKQQIIH